MKRVLVKPVPGTTIAESKDEARDLRRRAILPTLNAGETVILDFASVGFTTQSFVHALISEAIRIYGDASFDLIKFENCTPEVREVVLTVFEYTLAASDAAAGEVQASPDKTST